VCRALRLLPQQEGAIRHVGVGTGVIKVYRELSGAAIKDAKDFIEGGAGKPLKAGIPRAEAESLKAKFEQAGAKVSIR
jgi:large subunit ribosomal protein L7/L12